MALDKATRNTLRNAVTRCRRLLEEAVGDVLEGQYGVHRDGRIEDEAAMGHLPPDRREDRARVLASLAHIRARGVKPAEAVPVLVREAAYTHLNRLCAYKMLEGRKLVREAVGRGPNSTGFKVYLAEHPEAERLWSTGRQDVAYRHFLDWLGKSLSTEIGVLFSPTDSANRLYPPQRVLDQVLAIINGEDLREVWDEEETIGWVYQYFTPKELRDKARKESAAPRNADELAFRNQFYTPRYVVEFLTENTLGRTWYEMGRSETALAERRYFVRRKHPIWLGEGADAPEPFPECPPARAEAWPSADPLDEAGIWVRPNPTVTGWDHQIAYAHTLAAGYDALPNLGGSEAAMAFAQERWAEWERTGTWTGTFEELRLVHFARVRNDRVNEWVADDDTPPPGTAELYRAIGDRWDLEVETIPHRPKKDPRELRVLDPACGSGHFLLYAFDLLLTMYREAWDDSTSPPFAETGHTLRDDYTDPDAFPGALPGLILRHNLHGIDIDLRAVQIAQLALWLRAQRAYADVGLALSDRPPITRVNVVAAEPLPGERDLLAEFQRTLDPPVLADLVGDVWEGMAGIGEIGSLFKAEDMVRHAVAEAKREWQSGSAFDQVTLFAADAPPKQERLDLSFISDEAFWQDAERRVRVALRLYAESVANGDRYRRRLFADDAAQGFAFLELFEAPFDIVLMNPPFGAVSQGARGYIERNYPRTKNDLYAAFVEHGLEVLHPGGYLGAITSRTGFFLTSFRKWREEIILAGSRIHVVADLGQGVLDTAMVETAVYALERAS